MRVIAGTARGVRLKSPKGRGTRPTSDMMRESLFAMIGEAVVGCEFLDLYAGTGSVGIEALSRGASGAFFVEDNDRNARLIEENLRITGFRDKGVICRGDVLRWLRGFGAEGRAFDIIFLDPPYEKGMAAAAMRQAVERGVLRHSGLLVAEHSRREEIPEKVGLLRLVRRGAHGDTVLSFYRLSEGEGRECGC